MIIATSITQDYLSRSQSFFDSVNKYWPEGERKICFCIGFEADLPGWEVVSVPFAKLSYNWQPTNRASYYSLQHGSFTEHIPHVGLNEMVLFVDSDMVLQRLWELHMPATDGLCVTSCSWPEQSLDRVAINLNPALKLDKFVKKYPILLRREFCAGFMMAKVKTWRLLYAECQRLYPLLDNFTHHATWQLLINAAAYKVTRVFVLPEFICNAEWYSGTRGRVVDNVLWIDTVNGKNAEGAEVISSEKVYFNHTKFST